MQSFVIALEIREMDFGERGERQREKIQRPLIFSGFVRSPQDPDYCCEIPVLSNYSNHLNIYIRVGRVNITNGRRWQNKNASFRYPIAKT
jgi:hypothetical protein